MFTERYELGLYTRTYVRLISVFNSSVTVQADSRQPLTVKVRVRSQANRGQFHRCQSDSGKGLSLRTSVFPCQYHCTNAPHCPVSITARTLHTPLSVSLHERSTLPCQYHCTNAPHSSSCTCCSYQKDKGQTPGSIPKSNALLEIGEYWIEKYFHFAVFKAIRAAKYSTEDMFINCNQRTHCKVCQKSEISQRFGTQKCLL